MTSGDRDRSPSPEWKFWPPYPKQSIFPGSPPPPPGSASPCPKCDKKATNEDDGYPDGWNGYGWVGDHIGCSPKPAPREESELEDDPEEREEEKKQGIPAWAAADAPSPWPVPGPWAQPVTPLQMPHLSGFQVYMAQSPQWATPSFSAQYAPPPAPTMPTAYQQTPAAYQQPSANPGPEPHQWMNDPRFAGVLAAMGHQQPAPPPQTMSPPPPSPGFVMGPQGFMPSAPVPSPGPSHPPHLMQAQGGCNNPACHIHSPYFKSVQQAHPWAAFGAGPGPHAFMPHLARPGPPPTAPTPPPPSPQPSPPRRSIPTPPWVKDPNWMWPNRYIPSPVPSPPAPPTPPPPPTPSPPPAPPTQPHGPPGGHPGHAWLSLQLHDMWNALPPGGRPSRTLMGVMTEQGRVYQQGGGVHYEGPGGQAVLGNGLQWAYVTPAAAPIADWTPHDLPMFRP